MRLALIDLGTNAVRFDVQEIRRDGGARRLHRERLMVRLGEDVFRTGRLSRAAAARTVAAFRSFHRTCLDLRVDKTVAFGTSALREASDSERFLKRLRDETGIEVRVISGAEEARLIAMGILAHEKLPKGLFALVDVGGGSVEITLCRRRRILRAVSLELGVARLQQTFLKSVPPPAGGVDALRRHVRGVIKGAAPRGGWPSVQKILGSGGTVRALIKLWTAGEGGGDRFNAKDMDRVVDRLAPLSLPRLLRVPGMEPKRAELILAGAVVLSEISAALDAEDVQPTDYALRDGLLEEEIRLHGPARGRRRTETAFPLADVFARAEKLGSDGRHARRVALLCESLFDGLKPLHRLSPAWRDRLRAAAALHDVGEAVSPIHHERHAHYVALHADFPFMEPWEHEFVAQLCLWHKGGKVDEEEVPFWNEAVRRNAFLKLLGILRVADALDRGHGGKVSVRSVQAEGRAVRLRLSGAGELERLRLEQKKELFEKVFGKSLEAR
jgi:exopolyphosphatase/guanosine-5'-triphosphate,3'-diphosphate pyrophosphatase